MMAQAELKVRTSHGTVGLRPAAGGPSREQLTPEQREADDDARLISSTELGHGREAIAAAYLGR